MFRVIALVVCIFAGLCHASTRIVGGSPTAIDNYPSLVQVDFNMPWSYSWDQSCAANILNPLFVLSAAHCFSGPSYHPTLRRIRAGSTYRNFGGVIIHIERPYNHPSYGSLGHDGDISVVKLQSRLEYSPVIQPATIIGPNSTPPPDNLPVVHAGWGATSQTGLHSHVLRDVLIYTVNNNLCRDRYLTLPNPGIITSNMICAGVLDVGGRDACQGDSGGPLYFTNFIIGIISWGHGCANPTFPGISTAVTPYARWIVATATV